MDMEEPVYSECDTVKVLVKRKLKQLATVQKKKLM
jgi:hypothetical protein